MKFGLKIEGGERLARGLRELPESVRARVIREDLREAAEPIRARTESLIRRVGGAPDLADHIVIGRGTLRGETDIAVAVGASKDARSDQPDRTFDVQHMFYEFGTSRHGAFPTIRPAFDSEVMRALAILIERLWARISQKASQVAGGVR